MKIIFQDVPGSFLLLIVSSLVHAQTDPTYHSDNSFAGWPNEEYMELIYNPETMTYNPSYNYSDKWDLDGDGKKDSLLFIGNDGAHAYFYLRLILSSDNKRRDYNCIRLDMPYARDSVAYSKKKISTSVGRQFIISDLNADGLMELHFYIPDPHRPACTSLSKSGITSNHLSIYFSNGELQISDSTVFE